MGFQSMKDSASSSSNFSGLLSSSASIFRPICRHKSTWSWCKAESPRTSLKLKTFSDNKKSKVARSSAEIRILKGICWTCEGAAGVAGAAAATGATSFSALRS